MDLILSKIYKLLVFLEFSRNRLVTLKARQATHASRTFFLVFLCTAWRLCTNCQALWTGLPKFPSFWCFSSVVMFGLDFYMYVYDWHDELLSAIVYLVKITW